MPTPHANALQRVFFAFWCANASPSAPMPVPAYQCYKGCFSLVGGRAGAQFGRAIASPACPVPTQHALCQPSMPCASPACPVPAQHALCQPSMPCASPACPVPARHALCQPSMPCASTACPVTTQHALCQPSMPCANPHALCQPTCPVPAQHALCQPRMPCASSACPAPAQHALWQSNMPCASPACPVPAQHDLCQPSMPCANPAWRAEVCDSVVWACWALLWACAYNWSDALCAKLGTPKPINPACYARDATKLRATPGMQPNCVLHPGCNQITCATRCSMHVAV
jgi:hypothetical protein